MRHIHRMDHGATLLEDGRARFRIWAPSVETMSLSLNDGAPHPMHRHADDWFSIELPAHAGARYCYVLPDGLRVPDPCSRQQDGDVHDASLLIDPLAFSWQHTNPNREWQEAVFYEIHPGIMGGFRGVTEILPRLADLGVTAIELMPVNDFPGKRNWGYDGVLPYAPDTAYGSVDDLKQLIDTAHGLGLMVFLDVVYNHFGPDGAYIHVYANHFFTEEFQTPWGASIDFRREVVQEYFVDNAIYWLKEYRFDGLRFDALGHVEPQEVLAVLARRIRAGVEPDRRIHLVMEHEFNAAWLLRGSFDAQWTDDIHHALHVLLTGDTSGYYEDFEQATELLARSLAEGFAYQGERSRHSGKPRGEPSANLPTSRFVVFAQNHDQIGNRAIGDRLTALVEPAAVRAARAFLLLSPFIPLLFMGEEWATTTPFLFFTDHNEALATAVREGRQREFAAFFASHPAQSVPDPNDIESFRASLFDPGEYEQPGHREELALTKHLLALRRQYLVGRIADAHSAGSRVLGKGAVSGTWTLDDGAQLSIALNLGAEGRNLDPTDAALIFASDFEAAEAGFLPANSVAVWIDERNASRASTTVPPA